MMDEEQRDAKEEEQEMPYGHFVEFEEEQGGMQRTNSWAKPLDYHLHKIMCTREMGAKENYYRERCHRTKRCLVQMCYIMLVTGLLAVSAMSLWDIF